MVAAPRDNEDRKAYYEKGRELEEAFVADRLPELAGVSGGMNPEKEWNVFAIDLVLSFEGSGTFQTDLKSVGTPFFKANDIFGLDPQYTASFNLSDSAEYATRNDILVMFDLNWGGENLSRTYGLRTYSVEPMRETYVGTVAQVWGAIGDSGWILWPYKDRVGKRGNSRWSWIFDARHLYRCPTQHAI